MALGLCNSKVWFSMAIFLYSFSFTLLPKMNLFLLKEKKEKKNTYVKITHPHHVQKSCVWQQKHLSEAKWHFSFLAKRAKKKKERNKKKKKTLLSQQLALNYWPLSVAAAKEPLVLEIHDEGRPTSPGGSGCNSVSCFAKGLKHTRPWLAEPSP